MTLPILRHPSSGRALRPRPAPPLAMAVHRGLRAGVPTGQQGLSLVELVLVIGVAAAAVGGVYGLYNVASGAARSGSEAAQLRELGDNIQAAYNASHDYGTLSTARALQDRLFPVSMVEGGGDPMSTWGGAVRVLPTDVERDGQTLANWGFVVAYDQVPSKACVDLAASAGPPFSEVRVEGVPIGLGPSLNIARLTELCDRPQGAAVQFVSARASQSSPGGALSFCADALPSPASESRTQGCPSGQYGTAIESRTAYCPTPYGPFSWTGWSVVSTACTACPSPETRVSPAQTVACPSGQIGTWTQVRDEQRTALCPQPLPGGGSTTEWGPWAATSGWRDLVNTCGTPCVLPAPSTEARWIPQSNPCPAGQAGRHTWEAEERRDASCPAPTGAYVWSTWAASRVTRNLTQTCAPCPANEAQTLACPAGQVGQIQQARAYACAGEGSWGAWTTTSNTCTACPAPQNQNLACPAGQVGSIAQTRAFNCAGPTGSWGAWTTTTNTCATCPGPETQDLSCPVGQFGSITQTRSYNCTGTGGWGSWTTTTNSCAPQCALPTPSTQTQTRDQPEVRASACPAGQYGPTNAVQESRILSQSQSRSATCPAPTGAYVWGAWSPWVTDNTGRWTEISNACLACPGPSTDVGVQWVDTVGACPVGQAGSYTWQREQRRTRSMSYTCPAATTALPPATYGAWTGWGDTGLIRNAQNTCAPTCVAPAPSYEYGTWTNCPVNRITAVYGERRRLITWTCPGPTSAVGAWENTSLPECCPIQGCAQTE